MANERDRLMLEAAYLRQQAEELERQVQQLAALLSENQAAQASLDALSKTKSAATAAAASEAWLSPLGAGVYAKTKPAAESVVIEVGSRVAAEKSPSEAKGILAERARAIEKALGDAQSGLNQALRRMDELAALAESGRQ